MKLCYILVFFLTSFILTGQEIQGIVLDKETDLPIETASIYFDNTTLGTTSDVDGKFSITYDPSIKSPLVISYLGYETIAMQDLETNVLYKIYLTPSVLELDEVVINPDDDWTRSEKLEEFKKHFLGETINGMACEIENESDIRLYYSIRKKQLRAVCRAPISIVNPNLNYKVKVDLKDFEVSYSYVSEDKKRKNTNSVYYAGSNFFQSLNEEATPSALTNRLDVYKGSALHFMRAITSNQLEANGYKLFKGKYPVNPKRQIKVTQIANSNSFSIKLRGKLRIVYNEKKASTIECKSKTFEIDEYGNHSPIDQVHFGGFMGNQRIGDTLPLDYKVVVEE
ncbi:MAG: carboxypeptidase-like regulatory domain-containing protein [bacterium]